MVNKRIKHCVGDIVIASGNFYACPDRVVKVLYINIKGELKGTTVCRDINGRRYIGHNDDFYAYEEVTEDMGLWKYINHDHEWLVNRIKKKINEVIR